MNRKLVSTFLGSSLLLSISASAYCASEKDADLTKARSASEETGKLSDEQLARLLEQRLPGGMGISFAQLTKMSLVANKASMGRSISVATKSDKIAKTTLRSNFPSFYKPTLAQFLDAVGLQTRAQWKYDPSGKSAEGENGKKSSDIIFEFNETTRRKPYELNLAKGWSTADNGNWVNCTPAGAPAGVGMDIYELGNFTSINKSNEGELLKQVPDEVSIEWARRVQPKAKKTDLKPSKVGTYDAVSFDSLVRAQGGKDVRWRQWVFMAGNQCFFIVSTIFPEGESKIFPDVEAMLKSFKLRS